MSDISFTPETFTSQFVPKVPSSVPNVEELQTRLALMAKIPNSGIDVKHDTEGEALTKLAKIGVTGDNVPLSDNQKLAKDYALAAQKGTEGDLVKQYQSTHNENLNKLLDAYVIESKIRNQALDMPNHRGELLRDQPEAFGLVITRVQQNVAMTIETGAQLQTNGIKPTAEERLAIMNHLEKIEKSHPDSQALINPLKQYESSL